MMSDTSAADVANSASGFLGISESTWVAIGAIAGCLAAVCYVVFEWRKWQDRKQREAQQSRQMSSVQDPAPTASGQSAPVTVALNLRLIRNQSQPLEAYIERAETQRLDDQPFIIFVGSEGVGKTREVIEYLTRRVKRTSMEVVCETAEYDPSGDLHVRQLPTKNLIYVHDDFIVPELEDSDVNAADYLLDLKQKLIQHTHGECCILLTMRPASFRQLMAERSSEQVKSNFSIIDIPLPSKSVRTEYVRRAGASLNLGLADVSLAAKIASEAQIPFRIILTQLQIDKDNGFAEITEDTVERIKQSYRRRWNETLNGNYSGQKWIFESLSTLSQFQVPFREDLVIELSPIVSSAARKRRHRKIAKRAIRALTPKMLDAKDGIIRCDSWRYDLADDHESLDVKRNYATLLGAIGSIKRQLVRHSDYYNAIQRIPAALTSYGMHDEAIGQIDEILKSVGDQMAPERRSRWLMHKGKSYLRKGRGFSKAAKQCFEESLSVWPENPHTKHALASLCIKLGDMNRAEELLKEAVKTNPTDLLAVKSQLEMLIDQPSQRDKLVAAYRSVKRLLHDRSSYSIRQTMSARFACIRAYAKSVEEDWLNSSTLSESKARGLDLRIRRLLRSFSELAAEAADKELRDYAAVFYNAYGCFLEEVLGDREGAMSQLRNATECDPAHVHSHQKWASILLDCMRDNRDNPEVAMQFAKEAQSHLEIAQSLESDHLGTRLSLARLKGLLFSQMDDERRNADEFWKPAEAIYDCYLTALDDQHAISYHNSIVHHSAATFLWNIEASAKRNDFRKPTDSHLPEATAEFEQSLMIRQHPMADKSNKLREQAVIVMSTFGEYLMTLAIHRHNGDDRRELVERGRQLLDSCIGELSSLRAMRNAHALFYVSHALRAQNRIDEAEEFLRRCIKALQTNWSAHWCLGEILAERKRWDDAVREFETAAHGWPSVYWASLREVASKWEKDNIKCAALGSVLEYSERAYQANPGNALNVSKFAFALFKEAQQRQTVSSTEAQSQFARAKRLFGKAYHAFRGQEQVSHAAFAIWYYGACRWHLNRHLPSQIILTSYVTAFILDPERWMEELTKIMFSLSTGNDHEGTFYVKRKGLEECLQAIWRALQKNANSEPLWQVFGSLSTRLWVHRERLPNEVFQKFESLIKNQPTLPTSQRILGRLYANETPNSEVAIPYLETWRDPADKWALHDLMQCYEKVNRHEDAELIRKELTFGSRK